MPPRTQTGNLGATEVAAAFERLNWGVADNSRHDVGTDLLVMARDERGVELCLLVGVQVKTRGVGEGPGKYFSEPVTDAVTGQVSGWWFRDEDRRHVDSWLRYEVPHLLVLHDANTRTSFWTHITEVAVVPTGKGAKVFVPANQTIDLGHRDQLLAVAATQRPHLVWEGSAWRGPGSIAPTALLRHALIVPRLVAPHPNLTLTAPLTPEQALALVARVQINDLRHRLAMQPLDDDLQEALDQPGWAWRLTRALLHQLTNGERDEVLAAMEAANDPAERVAATVIAAAALLGLGNAEEADRLLVTTLERDDAHPIDHAWLSLQHARCLIELGRDDDAREHLLVTQRARSAYPDDLTASAIGGIGAIALYRITRRETPGRNDKEETGRLADGVAGLDTTAVWWRALDTTDALRASANQAYRVWARDTAITWAARDTANDDLVATSLMAGHLGDQGAWSSLTALLAKENLRRLERTSEAKHARAALSTLRLSGDHKSTKLATRRLVRDGPASAAAQVAAECDLDTTTRTTARTSLIVLREAGDLLNQEAAERACTWLLNTLEDPTAFVTRTRPSYLLLTELVDTLAGVIKAASDKTQQKVAELLANLPAQPAELYAASWARLARALPADRWEADTAARLAATAPTHHEELRVVAHEIAALHHPVERDALLPLIRQGSQAALSAFGDVRELPAETAGAYVGHLVASCEDIQLRAKNLSRAEGGDRLSDLAMLNGWHPDQAQWEPLLKVLADPLVWPKDKNAALRRLAQLRSQLSDAVARKLRPIAEEILIADPLPAMAAFGEDENSRSAALDLAYSLAERDTPVPAVWRTQLLDLLGGDRRDRRWAAYIARHDSEPAGAGLLVALLQDTDPIVRAEAVDSIVSRAENDPDVHSLRDTALDRAATDPGTVVTQNLVAAIERSTTLTDAHRAELLRRLTEHSSATVRSRAKKAQKTPSAGASDDSNA
ncbi:DUF4365 domain-containing protein [Actinomycetospora straminea]|uniref:DUF4365 domain-containing protein n=1 Tax=Actinomycetospora straminea TaxID=663607 RepID=A0ABP9F2Y7_9PSEU|nr:DUF4365 domain-containing protein [Actinomycetospora straminea]MDD7936156.1 DUF4365 domain-containing protein [Actinomycetospora straminea]